MSDQPATNQQAPPREMILRTCRALFEPGQVAELRVIGAGNRDGNIAAGWFNDFDAIAAAALREEQRGAEGLYVTLNPVNRACFARSPNEAKPYQKTTTKDSEIIARTWLPIDIDPVRPTKVSSSEEEVAAARNKAREIIDQLERVRGWPKGLRGFSSNGYHLLYRIDFANDRGPGALVEKAIKALSEQFSDNAVKVDTTVWNAARIWKLWGTLSRKGASIEERPHRRSYMLPWRNEGTEFYPTLEDVQLVPLELVESLAGDSMQRRPPAPGSPQSRSGFVRDFDLDAFIARNAIKVSREEPWDGTGKRYILEACVFDPTHVGTGAALGRTPSGAIFYRCQHNSCSGRKWADVRRLFEPSKGQGRRKPGTSPSEVAKETDNPWELARSFLKEVFQAEDGNITIRNHIETWYEFDAREGCYKVLSAADLKSSVTSWLSDKVQKITRSLVGDVIHCVGVNVNVPGTEPLPVWCEVGLGESQPWARVEKSRRKWLCMKNGVLDLEAVVAGKEKEDCIFESPPEWLNIIKLGYDFDPTATCGRWLRFINEILEDDEDRIAILQEAFGYCLWDTTELETFFVFIGSGANGKSTTLNILEKMLDTRNCEALSPTDIDDKVMVLRLRNKLANICSDMDDMDKIGERMIKKIASGETLVGNPKFKDTVDWKSSVKLFFATNMLPRFVDITQGIWRRAVIIPFDVRITNEQKDTQLLTKLEAELPGIFNWAIQGMMRLIKNREFSESLECQRTHKEYRRLCFPILSFLDEETITGIEESVSTDVLYQKYCEWCKENGLSKPKPLHMFGRDVKEFRPTTRKERITGQERKTMITGIGLRIKEMLGQ